MAFRDILLLLDTYPEPTPPEIVDQAAHLCGYLAGAATAVGVHVQIPVKSNVLAERLLHLSSLAADEEARSLEAAQSLLRRFSDRTAGTGVYAPSLVLKARLYDIADRLAEVARSRDLCVIPLAGQADGQRSVAEAVIFGSGRPVIVFQGDGGRKIPKSLSKVLIAWDGSRQAARAVADALPLLTEAKEVLILTVLNDKPATQAGAGAELARHLALHGVEVAVDELDAGGAPIGTLFAQYVTAQSVDLVVMGAFGHSRAREFVLGGATHSMLEDPPVPVFLSH